ncbi:RND transporter [Thermosipho melanesiensis]|uniref:Exporter of the RND superfamily-like protein n=2 Tax=Thermosipho melanesiensis TaxID=46541 RepID=A6LM56_THEM4|nr:efflux RND transporter permease subunit [Thermosipho melanesiensis]ABR31007.1 exporter of the RND superfamily-like protein [Thermosipho melanesiensis BI429]APT74101.1 RND transporter [Thermosipho melanesiensis]OOC36048.1 RND transporter [Thermosipho melanesiensis]OOC36865.1 RND transporter [Thermosipho melanesiensis]OOC37616.1 RND transporter [Thermosipho melanesiensis]
MSKFYEKHAKKIIVLLVILNIAFFLGMLRIRFNTDFSLFRLENSKYEKILKELEKDFSTENQLNVLIEFDENPLSLDGIRKIKEYDKKLKSIDGIGKIISPVPDEIPFGFRKVNVENINEENFEIVKNFLEKLDIISQRYGKFYVIYYIFPTKRVVSKIDEVIDLPHYFAGSTYLQEKMYDYLLLIVFTLPPLAIVTIFLVFRWRLGGFRPTLFSVLPAGMGALWTLGIIGWTEREISILTILAPIFTIVMGSADGLHFVSHFMDNKENKDKFSALSETLKSTGFAMILTTITTVAGFLSLAIIDSESLAQMGKFSAIGVAFAGIATWVFLPVVLLKSDIGVKKEDSKISRTFRNMIGKRAVFITILIVVVFFPGVYFLDREFYMLDIFKDYTQVKKNSDVVQKVAGITVPVFGYFKTENLLSAEFANKVLDFEKGLKAISFYDIMKNINEKIFGQEGYPDNVVRVRFLLNLLPPIYDNFVNLKIFSGRVLIFPEEINSKVLNEIEKKAPEDIKITGAPYIMKEMNDVIVPQQIKSLLLAVFLVFLIVFVRLKNLKESFFAILPISLTLIVMFGFMGIFGIKLSIITATMGSIVVGVGIDYAIHFIESYNYYLRLLRDKKRAIEKSFDVTSKPILANALGLSIGLSVLLLSPLKIHEYLVGLMWVSMISSAIFSLTLLPTLLFVANLKKNGV